MTDNLAFEPIAPAAVVSKHDDSTVATPVDRVDVTFKQNKGRFASDSYDHVIL